MSVIDDVAAKLQADGVIDAEWPAALAWMPPDQDQCIAVFEYPGSPPDQSRMSLDFPQVQVRVRGPVRDYVAGRAKWAAAFASLHNQTVADWHLCQATLTGPAAFWDNEERPNFASSFQLVGTRS